MVSPDYLEYNYVKVVYQKFELFLMYKSNNTDSIWIPLAKMAWDWYGDAQSPDGQTWNLVPYSYGHVTTNPSFIETNSFPEWEDTAGDENPEWEDLEE